MQLIEAMVSSGHIPQLQSSAGQDAVPGTASCGRSGKEPGRLAHPPEPHPSPGPYPTWAEAVASEGPVESLRGGVRGHRHGQQRLALLHHGHRQHLLPQELWRVLTGGAPEGKSVGKVGFQES